MDGEPAFRLSMEGAIANRMIQYMAALKLKALVPDVRIVNVDIPDWGIYIPDIEPPASSHVLPWSQKIDFDGLASGYTMGAWSCAYYPSYAQHVDNFLPREHYEDVFPSTSHKLGWDEDHLVISIRGGEILDARHKAYVLLPMAFYASLIEETRLKPVFMGQLSGNPYADALRSAFPNAEFQDSRGAMYDFQALRQSRNVVPSVSTFSWLACWLSDATVHLPLAGLFNPFQETEHSFTPLERQNFRFYTFPIMYAVPVSQFRSAHRGLTGRWKRVSADVLSELIRQRPRFRPSKAAYEAALDPEYYLSHHEDLQQAFGDNIAMARWHYHNKGYDEGRRGFAMSDQAYSRANPAAAESVGRGDFRSFSDYHAEACLAEGAALHT